MKIKLITIALLLLVTTYNAQKTLVSDITEVDLSKTEQSGYVNWDFTDNTSGYAWTWGAPGMLVYGEEPELCMDIEAEIKNLEHVWAAGISIGVNESSTTPEFKFNGINNYYLAVEDNKVILSQGTNYTGEDFVADTLATASVDVDQTQWHKLRLKIETDTIYGYVNDVLYINHRVEDIQKNGKFAIVSSNGINTYKNIKARYHKDPYYISSDTIVEYVSDINHPEYNNLPIIILDNVETVVESDGLNHFISHYIHYMKAGEDTDGDEDNDVDVDEDECNCICPTATTLSIYPNPVSEYINVSIQQPSGKLKVYSMHGADVKSYDLKYGINRIDITRYPIGHYLFKVEYEGRKALIEKIIVNH